MQVQIEKPRYCQKGLTTEITERNQILSLKNFSSVISVVEKLRYIRSSFNPSTISGWLKTQRQILQSILGY